METHVAYSRAATRAEKLRETKVWVSTPGLALGHKKFKYIT